jgi:hypothetical protein
VSQGIIVNASNMLPGVITSGSVTITNTSNVSVYVWLTESNVSPAIGTPAGLAGPTAPNSTPVAGATSFVHAVPSNTNPSCVPTNTLNASYGYGCGNLATQLGVNIYDATNMATTGYTSCSRGISSALSPVPGTNPFNNFPATASGSLTSGIPLPNRAWCQAATAVYPVAPPTNLWAAGESHTYQFNVNFPSSADNSYQNTAAQAEFDFSATQNATGQ